MSYLGRVYTLQTVSPRTRTEEKTMSTRTYSVPGVSCGHCRTAITNEVAPLEGVESVEVDLDAKTVTVTGEPLDEQAILAAIDEAGYEVAA
jgi:copper chaperone CopZ